MKRRFRKQTLFLTLGLLMSPVSIHAGSATDAADTSTAFKEIIVAPGLAQANSLIGTLLPFLTNHPETDEGAASTNLSVEKADSGFTVNIIHNGYLDDSVRGEHFQGFVIFTSNGTWELISMRVKSLCARALGVNGNCH